MAVNAVKYATIAPSSASLVGSVAFGWPDGNYGPSETSGWYSGITPPSGGYVIYATSASQIISATVASNDADLITIGKEFTGQNFTSSAQAQTWMNANGYAIATTVYSQSADMLRASLVNADTASYDLAVTNAWVKITSQSYVNLSTNISNTFKYGNTDSQLQTRDVLTGFATMSFGSGSISTPLTISTGQYLYAFVAEPWNMNGQVKVGYTTTFTSGSPIYFPFSASTVGGGRNYYVRKRPGGIESAPATQDIFPVIAMSTSPNAVANTFGWYYNGTTWISGSSNQVMKHQFLVTTTQQW